MSNYFLNRYALMTGDSPDEVFSRVVDSDVLRVNTLVVDEQELVSRLEAKGVRLSRISAIPLAYRYVSSFSLGATPEYLLGYYYLQEPASQLPVLALANQDIDLSSSTILDMCAAPGSKTTQLAALMNNEGRLVALDSERLRAEALANNCERCRVSNTQVYHKDALFVSDLNTSFDAVLLDAPCSGNFCSQKNWLKKRKPSDASEVSRLQKDLLQAAFSTLKPGGFLIYSTCSLEVEENEQVVDMLGEEAVICDAGLSVGSPALSSWKGSRFRSDMNKAVRVWPHRDRMQGFFLAVIQKA